MKLSNIAIEALKDRKLRLTMAYELDFSEVWMNSLVNANKENGPLTTIKAISILKRETGLSDEAIVCDESEKTEVN